MLMSIVQQILLLLHNIAWLYVSNIRPPEG
jgi:hypothetical protein